MNDAWLPYDITPASRRARLTRIQLPAAPRRPYTLPGVTLWRRFIDLLFS